MQDPVDNKKKWQVTGTILFAAFYPYVSANFVGPHAGLLLFALLCVLPPAVAIYFLPYKKQMTAFIAILYFVFMLSGLMVYGGAAQGTPA